MDTGVMTYFNEVLQERLRQLLSCTADLCTRIEVEKNLDGPIDEVESTVARSQEEFRLHMRQRNRALLLEIQEALRLIQDGEFGTCLECGGSIGIARLKAQPMTTVCIERKKEMEKAKKRIVAS
jgi:DnaK suppressor protein